MNKTSQGCLISGCRIPLGRGGSGKQTIKSRGICFKHYQHIWLLIRQKKLSGWAELEKLGLVRPQGMYTDKGRTESSRLFWLAYQKAKSKVRNGSVILSAEEPRIRRKYRRGPLQTCPRCGKVCRGNGGIALHSLKTHHLASARMYRSEPEVAIPVRTDY